MTRPSQSKSRPQVTAYLHPEIKSWLEKYAKRCHLNESEIVRILLEREQQIGWLEWALTIRDPAQGSTGLLPSRNDGLPPRYDDPPTKRKGRKPKTELDAGARIQRRSNIPNRS
jgi:hypothetical protein